MYEVYKIQGVRVIFAYTISECSINYVCYAL